MEDINGVDVSEYIGPSFSINLYDRDGDVYDRGIFLHYQNTMIRVATTLRGFRAHIKHLQGMAHEIEENWMGDIMEDVE